MGILVVSISHKTATMAQLAQVSLDAHGVTKLVHGLLECDHVEETVVVSTCNRTEVYASVSRFHGGLDDIVAALSESSGLALADLPQLCSVFYDEAAVAHLFQVASGLDSMVAGENQILGQVKAALTQAQQAGAVGSVLNGLFQQGIRVGKRVQHETSVGSAGRSLMSAGLDELAARGHRIGGARALVVGAGSMAALAAHTLRDLRADLTLVNRTHDKADRLAQAVQGRSRPWAELADALAETDVLVTCTGARGYVVTGADLAGTPVAAVIDLALPADVHPDVAYTRTLVNLDGLQSRTQAPAEGLEAATALVAQEVNDFLGARRAAQVTPTVVALRTMASEVVGAELARLDAKLPDLDDAERAAVHNTVRRVADKLLHQPTVRVQAYAADPQTVDYAAALRDLFALDPHRVSAVLSPGDAREAGPAPAPERVAEPRDHREAGRS